MGVQSWIVPSKLGGVLAVFLRQTLRKSFCFMQWSFSLQHGFTPSIPVPAHTSAAAETLCTAAKYQHSRHRIMFICRDLMLQGFYLLVFRSQVFQPYLGLGVILNLGVLFSCLAGEAQ